MRKIKYSVLFQPQLAKITRVPFPCELLLVVGGVLLSDYFDLPELYGLSPIGEIPKGYRDFTYICFISFPSENNPRLI